jgi:hypothetical protein
MVSLLEIFTILGNVLIRWGTGEYCLRKDVGERWVFFE